VISDVRLPDVSGEDVFIRAKDEVESLPPFLFITAHASVDRAVEMLKRGALDYVTKPFDIGELVAKVRRAVEPSGLAVAPLGEEAGPLVHLRPWLLAAQAPRIAERARTVLIAGESGAERKCALLHALAHPRGAPFVAVNCGTFGDIDRSSTVCPRAGAYTGPIEGAGTFEQAHWALVSRRSLELTPSTR
jgi:DNA-binding NtrC family response regulator